MWNYFKSQLFDHYSVDFLGKERLFWFQSLCSVCLPYSIHHQTSRSSLSFQLTDLLFISTYWFVIPVHLFCYLKMLLRHLPAEPNKVIRPNIFLYSGLDFFFPGLDSFLSFFMLGNLLNYQMNKQSIVFCLILKIWNGKSPVNVSYSKIWLL